MERSSPYGSRIPKALVGDVVSTTLTFHLSEKNYGTVAGWLGMIHCSHAALSQLPGQLVRADLDAGRGAGHLHCARGTRASPPALAEMAQCSRSYPVVPLIQTALRNESSLALGRPE